MKNKDALALKKAEIMNRLVQAIKDDNNEAFQVAFTEFTDMLQESVLAEAQGYVQASDNNILTGRGARVLTSQEKKYYERVIEAWKSSDPKQALTLIDETLPTTVIDSIFEDIIESHPLLNAINFQNTGILTEILISNNDGRFLATWGKLCDTIVAELTAGTQVINLKQNKLSAFIPICKAMLEIGPEWIDRYVRTILGEAIANGLEKSIIAGTGVDEPVGMKKDPNGVFHAQNGYPDLVAIPLSEIEPATYGGIIAGLTVGPNGLNRNINRVLFIVNPVDYFTKLMPATTVLVNGVWVNDIFPFPTTVVRSAWVTQGEAIIGIGERYFFGLGSGSGGKIEYSDHYKFLEDDRYYLTKLYGDGKPLDSVSFKRLDISGLKQMHPIVRVRNYYNSDLASIVVAGGTLSPVFDASVTYYEADVAAAGAFTVVADDAVNATIGIKVNGSAATNGASVTWEEGANVVVVTVTNGDTVKTYVVVVTYTVQG